MIKEYIFEYFVRKYSHFGLSKDDPKLTLINIRKAEIKNNNFSLIVYKMDFVGLNADRFRGNMKRT